MFQNKTMCAALQEYMDRLLDIIVVLLDENGIIQYHNAGAKKLFKIKTCAEGESFSKFISRESYDKLMNSTKNWNKLSIDVKNTVKVLLEVFCNVYRDESGLLIVGGRKMLSNEEVFNKMAVLNNEAMNLYRELHRKNVELENALTKIKTLRGLIPICSSCKNIRDDSGYWEHLETYITHHSDAEFTHSICPKCAKQLYPDLDLYSDE